MSLRIGSQRTLLANVIGNVEGGGAAPLAPWLILYSGESNSGGLALNSDALAAELDPRPLVQILNNTTLLFESLDIGANNLIGHTGITQGTTHGWELGMANDVDAALWDKTPIYLVKTGQGGSTISQWNNGGSFDTTMKARVAAALSQLASLGVSSVRKAIWISFGINDSLVPTNTATWKTDTASWISRLRTAIGDASCKVIMTELPPNTLDKIDYTYRIYDLNAADANLYVAQAYDLIPVQGDNNHWTYAQMKTLASRMRQITLGTSQGIPAPNYYSGALTPVTWTDLTGGVADSGGGTLLWSSSASPTGARSTVQLDSALPFEVRVTYSVQATSDAIVVELSSTLGDYDWIDGDPVVSAGFHVSSQYFAGLAAEGGSPTLTTAFATFPAIVRLRSDHADVVYEKSTDGGSTWKTITSHRNRLSTGLLYLKIVNAAPASGDTVTVSYGQ